MSTGKSRLNLIVKYWQNSRLNEYKTILETALSSDYQCISLRDFAEGNFDPQKKLLILRHDVDHHSQASQMMCHIEKSLGARSSFYFRNCTINKGLMNEIENAGSEASLHFETIADYMKRNDIHDKKTLFASDFKNECLDELKSNLLLFRESLGLPCKTIASHGEAINRSVGIPNNFLTEDISSYEFLDIRLEAYNKKFLDGIQCYISDTVQEVNMGYRYGVHPIEAIEKGYRNILFLTHPNHWDYTVKQRLKKTVKLLIYKPVIIPESFQRI